MALEFPSSLIHRIQIRLRSDAGIPSYDPDQPSIDFPSLDEAIAQSEPSPPYLRCSQCRGRLLRGIQSMICVYCGSVQCRDGPLSSVSFNSTFGFRKLLESLQVDGSEPVVLGTAASDSSVSPNTSRDGLVLSDLLDIEIKWPEFSSEVQNITASKESNPSNQTLNLTGVDLDYFFSNAEVARGAAEEHSMPNEQIKSTESHIFSDQESPSMFQKFHSSNMAANLADNTGGNSCDSSLWDAEFQTASSGTLPADLTSSPIDLTRPVDADAAASNSGIDIKFEIRNQVNDGESKNNPEQASSMNNDWSQDDIWVTGDAKLSSKSEQFKIKSKDSAGELKNDSNNISSASDDWIQDDLWKTAGTSATANIDETTENDDSFGTWQDFSSSGNAPDPSPASWLKASTSNTITNGNALGVHSKGVNDDLEDMDFGEFVQPDLFADMSSIQTASTSASSMQLESSLLDRMEKKDLPNGADAIAQTGSCNGENFTETKLASSVDTNVDLLISQMPDLAFMLENNLSIPQKAKAHDSNSMPRCQWSA